MVLMMVSLKVTKQSVANGHFNSFIVAENIFR
jgi:hypothetical protein